MCAALAGGSTRTRPAPNSTTLAAPASPLAHKAVASSPMRPPPRPRGATSRASAAAERRREEEETSDESSSSSEELEIIVISDSSDSEGLGSEGEEGGSHYSEDNAFDDSAVVLQLNCGHCGALLSKRAMSTVMVADVNHGLYSSDLPTENAAARARLPFDVTACECRVRLSPATFPVPAVLLPRLPHPSEREAPPAGGGRHLQHVHVPCRVPRRRGVPRLHLW